LADMSREARQSMVENENLRRGEIVRRCHSWARAVPALIAMLCCGAAALGEDVCGFCKERKQGEKLYIITDKYHDKNWTICETCRQLTSFSVVCQMPVIASAGHHLPDGRIFCAEDSQTAVMAEAAATALFANA